MNVEVATETPRKRRKAPEVRDYTAIAAQWEEDVLSGAIPSGSLVRRAIERQRAEVAEPPAGYAWKAEEADKACALAEELAWPKGPKRGQRIRLEPWEVWLVRAVFGWVDSVTLLPRFSKVSIWLPKGNGKSPLAAAIGIIVLARGKAIGAKVYSAAVAEKQAKNVFEPAQEMLRLSPEVREAAGLVVGEHAIKGIGDPRCFEKISAEKRSADGSVGDCYIIDEIHQHPTRHLYDVLAHNASKVDGSRLVIISTAGTDPDPQSIGWLLYGEAKAVLEGEAEAPAHFALIFEADRKRADGSDTDPWDEATWREANPNYGVSISARNFRSIAEEARRDPTSQPHFLATRLGWWVRSAQKWMDPERWQAAAIEITEEHFAGRKVFVGVDYAPKLDFTAIVQVSATLRDDGKRQYAVRSHGYLPEGSPTRHLAGFEALLEWEKAGWLTFTPGDVLDAAYLRTPIVAVTKKYRGAEVCLDPLGCIELMASLPKEGVTPIEIRQGWKSWTPAMSEIQVALSQGRIVHDGNPLMKVCMSNVVAVPKGNGAVTADRENDAKKIDLAVALINAMVRAMIADLAVMPAEPKLWFID